VQVDAWLPVPHGTVALGDGGVDLRSDLDVGILEDSWVGLTLPFAGAGLGVLLTGGGVGNDATGLAVAAGVGATAVIAVLRPSFDLAVQYAFEPFGVRAEGFHFARDGEANLRRPVTFGGTTFAAGAAVDSEFRVSQARLLGLWTFVRPPEDAGPSLRDWRSPVVIEMRTAVSLLVGVGWVAADASLGTAVRNESGRASVVLPQLGLLLESRTGRWSFELELVGGADGTDSWLEGRAAAAYIIAEFVAIRIGYRYVRAELDEDGFAWSGSLEGFSFGAGLHF